ncbi:hypothetical protein BG52_12815 [Paenibacillus darwinianus]|nr:hypothetical protein BG52_12815 [Paenibacillus darwinianus]
MYAVPEECVWLVRQTGIDCLAPALGSVHGPYRGQPKLGFDRMGDIRRLTGLPLVLHGGSGLPDAEIRQAISLGTAKINVNTDNQMACTTAIRAYLEEHPAGSTELSGSCAGGRQGGGQGQDAIVRQHT